MYKQFLFAILFAVQSPVLLATEFIQINSEQKTNKSSHSFTYKGYLGINNPLLDEGSQKANYQNLLIQTAYMGVLGVGMVSVLWSMPSKITKWDKEQIRKDRNFFNKYKENIQSGPIWDRDELWINYIGHPLSGAAYYTMCRQNALNKSQCFLYTTVMSTFYWEYGFEALAEIPSKQDLIITPLAGSLLGEAFHKLKQNIKRNKGEILGSPTLGTIGMYLLDPAGHLTSGLQSLFSLNLKPEASQINFNQDLSAVKLQIAWTL